MKLLNGKELAAKIKEEVKIEVEEMAKKNQSVSLAVIQVGDDVASSTYVANKEKACAYCGIESSIYKFQEDITENDLIQFIECLNDDDNINGILVQLPLPSHINTDKVIESIAPEKDVDGFHESNVGKLVLGKETFVPCTAYGIIELLKENNIRIDGMNCVVVGRSDIVGKPVAIELLHNNATVTICHSYTKGLKIFCQEADILICAIGKPKFFNKDYISPNTVVVDVGIHRQEDGTLCGDVDFEDVKGIVSAISPVPNGVGSMTVAMLMKNCVKAARIQYEVKE